MKALINQLESKIHNPSQGLPDDIFYFIGRNSPFINVDLLIRDSDGNCLFTWRDDEHSGRGWHLPGGIIRIRETMKYRVQQVAKLEVGINLEKIRGPIAINEIIDPNKTDRSHFISVLFECLPNRDGEKLIRNLACSSPAAFHLNRGVPDLLLPWHSIYKDHLRS